MKYNIHLCIIYLYIYLWTVEQFKITTIILESETERTLGWSLQDQREVEKARL